MVERNKMAAARVGGLAIAVGAGAVIACSAAAPAWADEADTDRSSRVSTSEPSGARSTDGARSRDGADRRGRTKSVSRTTDSSSVEDRFGKKVVEPADDVDGTPDEPGSTLVQRIDDTATRAALDSAPPEKVPNAVPAAMTLLGSARRHHEDSATRPPRPDASGQPLDTEPAFDAAAPRQDPSGEVDELYTGEPSFVHNVVTAGLYVLNAVLKPFGGLLAFTSLKVPFFTDGVPPFFLTGGLRVERSEFEGMKVWTLTPRKESTEKAVVALHGGAYMATASIFHWWTYADMARGTGATVIVPLQTLVPAGGTAATEVPRTANFITKVIEDRGAENVSVFGDSAGGGLALAAMQELVRRNTRVPSRLVLLAPWLDVSMSDPRSAEIRDPLLDIANLTRSGAKWAGAAGPTDPLASPLFGSLEGLPPTYVYSSSLDMISVDTVRLRDRVLAEEIPDVTFRLRKGLIHDWFTFPFLPDAHEDRPGVYQDLLGTDEPTRPRPRDARVTSA